MYDSQTFIENAIQDPLYLCSFWRAFMHLFVFWTVLKSFFILIKRIDSLIRVISKSELLMV